MKIKNNFMVRQIVGEWVVIPVGERVVDFNGLITLNDTGAFLWELLQQDVEKETLLTALLDKFDIDSETASADLEEFLQSLRNGGILEE